MWSMKISRMIVACALLLAGLSVSALSSAVAQAPLSAPLAATYGAITPELPYVPCDKAPKASELLTLSGHASPSDSPGDPATTTTDPTTATSSTDGP